MEHVRVIPVISPGGPNPKPTKTIPVERRIGHCHDDTVQYDQRNLISVHHFLIEIPQKT